MSHTSISLSNRNLKDSDNIFEELIEFKDLIELDLSNNQFNELPEDLSYFEKITTFDITNNPLENFEKIVYSLSTLPSLTDLKINITNQKEAILILTNLPNLIFLNGKSTREDTAGAVDIDEREIDSFSLNNEIENFNGIFNRLNERMKPLGNNATKSFFEEFHRNLSEEVQKINGAVDNTIPNYIYAANLLKSKSSIYSFFHQKALSLLDKKDSQLSHILKDTLNYIKDSQNSLYDLLFRMNSKIEEKLESQKKQNEEALDNQNNLDKFKLEELERKLEESHKEKEFILSQNEEEKNILIERINRLESENKMMTDKLIQKAKDINRNDDREVSGVRNLNKSQDFSNRMNKSGINNIIVNPMSTRVLTKKMLLEIIEEIYLSKEHFDRKCEESKMPKETLEQHMYTFLNQKYGLKNLIIEWATSIINGIRTYSNEDSEICLFGKILRNELDEESRNVIQKAKSTIVELLSYFLKAKNPLKSQGDIKDLTLQKQNGYLLEDEWKGIIYYLFEKDDAYLIESKIVDFVKKKLDLNKFENKKMTREEIQNLRKAKEDLKLLYSEFLKIVLDYHIRLRDKYLRNFCNLFKKVDHDDNGIIIEEEFVNLLSLMNIVNNENLQEEADRLLTEIDPFNHNQITFSDCIQLFSNQFYNEIDEDGNKIKLNMLDRVSLNDENMK